MATLSAASTKNTFDTNKKIISISSKRQITIPQQYFDHLGFQNDAECILQKDGIFIRPYRPNQVDFSVQILEDLVHEGYSGEILIEQFKIQSNKIRPAVEALIDEADQLAKSGTPTSFDELFDSEVG